VTETLADVHDDIAAALEDLAACLGVGDECPRQPCIVPKIAEGHLTSGAVADVISAGLPEHAIVCDEGITCGLELFLRTQGAPPHDWLAITGGSIGQGLPVSFGAAIACPERKVVAFQADGSAMYTVQSLWSMVRERADVTVVLLNNSSYAILNVELVRLKAATPTPKTLSMLDLSNPIIDWVSIARGMGMEATRARKVSEFEAAFARAMAMRGPHLIEVILEQKLDAGMRR
jgi:acetolactate synthase-1/2/3 large subunit